MTFCFFSGAMIDCLSFEKRGSSSGHLYGIFVNAFNKCNRTSKELADSLDLFLYLDGTHDCCYRCCSKGLRSERLVMKSGCDEHWPESVNIADAKSNMHSRPEVR